jgi:hypothetical protein
MSMRHAIANNRRRIGGRHLDVPPVPPRTDQVRHNGFVCPTCLKFGQAQCREHREAQSESRGGSRAVSGTP